MPIYEYRCERCDHVQDAVRSVESRHDGPVCSRCEHGTNLVISPVRFNAPIWNVSYYDVGLGKPIRSSRERKYEMEKRGLVDAREYYESEKCPDLPEQEKAKPMKIPGELYDSMKKEGYGDMLHNVEIDQ